MLGKKNDHLGDVLGRHLPGLLTDRVAARVDAQRSGRRPCFGRDVERRPLVADGAIRPDTAANGAAQRRRRDGGEGSVSRRHVVGDNASQRRFVGDGLSRRLGEFHRRHLAREGVGRSRTEILRAEDLWNRLSVE